MRGILLGGGKAVLLPKCDFSFFEVSLLPSHPPKVHDFELSPESGTIHAGAVYINPRCYPSRPDVTILLPPPPP